MTITIDCRMLNSSGIGVYLRGCLPHFLKTDNIFFLLGDSKQLHTYISKNTKILNCKINPFSIKELFFFPASVLKQINKSDIYYSPFFNIPRGIKTCVYTTIHDIIFPDIPELLSKIGLKIRMWFLRRSYKISKKIFTVSNFSKSRIEHHLGTLTPVIVTYSAISQMYLDFRAGVCNVQKKDTIIFIGNIKKHKGLNCLLDAFILAGNEGLSHKLVIVGSKENFRTSDTGIIKKIDSIGEDAVSFTGFISNEDLLHNLSTASLLVQPSLYEGFCLPPLEAMVLGTASLISDIPVLKEIYSSFPVTFFKSGDSIDLKNKLIEMLLIKKTKPPVLPDDLLLKYTFDKTVSIILKELK